MEDPDPWHIPVPGPIPRDRKAQSLCGKLLPLGKFGTHVSAHCPGCRSKYNFDTAPAVHRFLNEWASKECEKKHATTASVRGQKKK